MTQFICEMTLLLFIIMGVIYGGDRFISMSVAAGFCFSMSIFSECAAEMYYEKKILVYIS